MRARLLLPFAAALALCATVSRAGRSGESGVAYSVEYQAPSGCPVEAAFVSEIAARTARAIRKAPDPGIPNFGVVLRSEGQVFSGSLNVRQPDRSTSTRSVRAPTCSEVAAALALVVALTLDPEAAFHRPLSLSPVPPALSSTAPAPSAAGRSKKENPSTNGANRQPSQPNAVAEPTAVAEPKKTSEVAVSDAIPNEVVAPRAPPASGFPLRQNLASTPESTHPPSDWGFSAGAGVAAQLALAPGWMLGGALHVAGAHRSGWTFGVGVAAFPPSRETTDGVTVAYGLFTLRGEGCYLGLKLRRLHALGCAAFEAGRLTASGEPGGPIVAGASGVAAWFAAVAIGRVGVPIGSVTLEGQGELLAPLSRNQFGIRTGPDFAGKHQPSSLGVGAGLAVTYRFSE